MEPELTDDDWRSLRGIKLWYEGEWRPPSKRRVEAFSDAVELVCEELIDPAFAPHIDECWQAVRGEDDGLPELTGELEDLRRAAMLPPDRMPKGRKALPHWAREVSERLFEIWIERTGCDPKFKFVPDPVLEPDTPFTNWYCEAMQQLDDRLSPSSCRTLLRQRDRTS